MAPDRNCPVCHRTLPNISLANFLWHRTNCKRTLELDQRAAELAKQSTPDLANDSKAISRLESAVNNGWTIVIHLNKNRVILYYRNAEIVGLNLREVLKRII